MQQDVVFQQFAPLSSKVRALSVFAIVLRPFLWDSHVNLLEVSSHFALKVMLIITLCALLVHSGVFHQNVIAHSLNLDRLVFTFVTVL